MTERPEDEQQESADEPTGATPEESEPTGAAPEESEPTAAAPEEPEPAAEPDPEPAAEPEPEPAIEAEAEPEPAAEPEVSIAAEAEPAPEPEPEPAIEAEAEPAPEPEPEPAIAAEAEVGDPDAVQPDVVIEAEQNPLDDDELEEVELAPRAKPEIPGADLIPDIVSDGEQFLDAEAQAAAEADAEAQAAAREQQEADEADSRPIADAAIDLAAGARYTATGKRKTAVARVIIKPGTGDYVINGKSLDAFFPRETLRRVIRQPLETVGYESRMDVVARMHGGGVSAQAGALRHGISRALIVADPNLRGELKRRGFLTRDPRVKERKKAGLKKARKRPQFSKR